MAYARNETNLLSILAEHQPFSISICIRTMHTHHMHCVYFTDKYIDAIHTVNSDRPCCTCHAVLSLRAGSRPKRPASCPSPAAYFCLSNIYLNKQNGNCACYQFPPCKWCNHLKNWLLFLASPTVDEKLVSNKKWLRKDSYAKFPCFNRNKLKDFRSYVPALSQGAWDVSLNGYQARA